MRKIIITLISIISFTATAQQNLDIGAPGETGGNYGTINYVDLSALGQKKAELISYTDISGSPFWDDNWNAALLFLNNKTVVKVNQAKLNLYTSEVHFIDKSNTEMSGESNDIKRVIFFKGTDTTKILALFESFADSAGHSKPYYYQILNGGKFRLAELKRIFLKEGEYNPMTGKRDHSFYSRTNYAIANNEDIIPIKSLNQANILPALSVPADAIQWLKSTDNKLKNTNQIVAFLNYYNTQKK